MYKMVRIETKRAVRRAKKEADLRWGEKLVEDFSSKQENVLEGGEENEKGSGSERRVCERY